MHKERRNIRNIQISPNLKSYDAFHTSASICGTNKVANAMRKVMGKHNAKKKFYYNETIPHSAKVASEISTQRAVIDSRRAVVLNKLFMRNITDLMSTGENAHLLLGLGVEVVKVQITLDYKVLKVYWSTQNRDLYKVEEILKRVAGPLRHELSTLRLMGQVPPIQFLRDKSACVLLELDRRLAVADYGEEGPSNIDPASVFISELQLTLPIDNTTKEKIKDLERQHPIEEDLSQVTDLPLMTNCVFGLDHTSIMNRIKQASRSRINSNTENWARYKLKQYSNSVSLDVDDEKSQREVFNKFLQQRQILKKRQKEYKRSIAVPLEDYELQNEHGYEYPDGDFIEEDEDNLK
ncbi:unnamed protein product [Phyllotreta striolata]|uniref:Ribosome-binding factor A, mitochondrial n=1 Tax=Phyllotreta striolata TaxID=444603 RepID=A0A9N9TQQ3_PHYSR|nr:unnamed protein product [Phyllotreta striolata]